MLHLKYSKLIGTNKITYRICIYYDTLIYSVSITIMCYDILRIRKYVYRVFTSGMIRGINFEIIVYITQINFMCIKSCLFCKIEDIVIIFNAETMKFDTIFSINTMCVTIIFYHIIKT